TQSRAAHEAYVRGRYFWHQRSTIGTGGLGLAVKHFKQAIDHDPLYAQAYTGLAECYAVSNVYTGRLDQKSFPRARAAAKKALELDDKIHEAHATLAFVKFYYEWDWKGAEKGYQRAIELNPNHATTRQWYAELLYFSQRFDESIAQLKKAAELDPLSPVIESQLGTPYLFRRDYKQARHEYEKAASHHPDAAILLYGLAVCEMKAGNLEEALKYYQKQEFLPGQAYVLGMLDRKEEARAILSRLEAAQPHAYFPYHLALIHIGLGEHEKAVEWLQTAFAQKDEHIVWLLVDPHLDPIRGRPEFTQLLKKVGWRE
ncbi:MAG: tetratricopeptide repeat protein, partial [Planctomycetota bacterium]